MLELSVEESCHHITHIESLRPLSANCNLQIVVRFRYANNTKCSTFAVLIIVINRNLSTNDNYQVRYQDS